MPGWLWIPMAVLALVNLALVIILWRDKKREK